MRTVTVLTLTTEGLTASTAWTTSDSEESRLYTFRLIASQSGIMAIVSIPLRLIASQSQECERGFPLNHLIEASVELDEFAMEALPENPERWHDFDWINQSAS